MMVLAERKVTQRFYCKSSLHFLWNGPFEGVRNIFEAVYSVKYKKFSDENEFSSLSLPKDARNIKKTDMYNNSYLVTWSVAPICLLVVVRAQNLKLWQINQLHHRYSTKHARNTKKADMDDLTFDNLYHVKLVMTDDKCFFPKQNFYARS